VTGWGSLTPAEQEVARTIAGGVTNREAGEALFVSENTIKTHPSVPPRPS
jgi:DNA-binding CsgD family transcriptional regulator